MDIIVAILGQKGVVLAIGIAFSFLPTNIPPEYLIGLKDKLLVHVNLF